MTGIELLEKLKKLGAISAVFRFPYAYLQLTHEAFSGLIGDDREEWVAGQLGVSISELRATTANCLISLEWLAQGESSAIASSGLGQHWLQAYLPGESSPVPPPMGPPVVHFYGYKGGQGRSTVLATVAQRLAENGTKVLVVDADLEAPSLHLIFKSPFVPEDASLLSLVQGGSNLSPLQGPVYRSGGSVHILGCRPSEPKFDMDFSAFTLRASLLPSILDKAIDRIREFASSTGFGAILVDHRSGMSVTAMTWLKRLPGPTALFSRLDGQWTGAEAVFRQVLANSDPTRCVFVTLKPDDEATESFVGRTDSERHSLLGLLVDEATRSTGEDLDPDDFEDRWVLWPHDPAFRGNTLPSLDAMSMEVRMQADEICRLLGFTINSAKKATASGATDPSELIQTEALLLLKQPENSIRYVFGRKGTGKTRLATALAEANLAEHLLCDDNSQNGSGLKSGDVEFQSLVANCVQEPIRLWWSLLVAALETLPARGVSVKEHLVAVASRKISTVGLMNEALRLAQNSAKRVFLIDGIETAFANDTIDRFLDSLFELARIVQTDRNFQRTVEIKIFLRMDLAARSTQNLEQQTEGRQLSLAWDYAKIVCFFLSRLKFEPEICRMFPEGIAAIEENWSAIRQAVLPAKDGEGLLLRFLPAGLSRSNILTTTFIKIHFSIVSRQGAIYIPRVFHLFAEELNQMLGHEPKVSDRIEQAIIYRAHENAAKAYLSQVKQELYNLVQSRSSGRDQVRKLVDRVIGGLKDKATPFVVPELVQELATELNSDTSSVRSVFDQMMEAGIFEPSSEKPDQWKAGRLFKPALDMRFNRKKGS